MKLIPLFIFWCLWFLNFSTRTAISPLLPLIEENLSISHGKAGGLFSSIAIGFGLSLLLGGRLVSVFGHKRTVVAGFLGIGLFSIGIQWAESYTAFHILFFLIGISTGSYIPAIIPIITETYELRHWGKAIGIHDSAGSFSIFLVPILVAFGLNFFPWRRLLLILGIASLSLPIYFWKISVEPKGENPQKKGNYRNLFRNKNIWLLALLSIFASCSTMGIYAILPLYLIKERGIEFSYANTLFGISRMGGVFISILSGYLTDHFGYRRIIGMSLLFTGLSTILLSFASALPLVLTILILQAIFPVAYYPAGFSAISRLTTLPERSMAIGIIFSIGTIFGMGATPFFLGLIADLLNFQIGILLLGILISLSSLMAKLLEEK